MHPFASGALAQLRSAARAAAAVRSTARPFAVELGSQQITKPPSPKEGVVEEDSQGSLGPLVHQYEGALHERSGTAEDVRVKDSAAGSLGKMAADPSAVELEYKRLARDTVSDKGGAPRQLDNPRVADAVMDDSTNTDEALAEKGVTGSEPVTPPPGTATQP